MTLRARAACTSPAAPTANGRLSARLSKPRPTPESKPTPNVCHLKTSATRCRVRNTVVRPPKCRHPERSLERNALQTQSKNGSPQGSVTTADEVQGFRYFDERDLLGFVDGTENSTSGAAAKAVFIGDEDPAFAGGSYVIVQKYLHNIEAWNNLSTEAQNRTRSRVSFSTTTEPMWSRIRSGRPGCAKSSLGYSRGLERQ